MKFIHFCICLFFLLPITNLLAENICPIDNNTDINDSHSIDSISGQLIKYINKKADVSGNAEFYQNGFRLYSPRIIYDTDSKTAYSQEEMYIEGRSIRLWVTNAQLLKNKDIVSDFTIYSRCAGDKENLDWKLYARQARYNEAPQSIDIYNGSIWFKNIPIFYIPWANFPLTRRSGFLFPLVGDKTISKYDWSGNFYQQPFYINLASNADNTVMVTWLEDRPYLFSNEFRYLNRKGEFDIHYDSMKSDSLLARELPNNHRNYERTVVNGNYRINSNLTTQFNWLEIYPRKFHDFYPTTLFKYAPTGSVNRQFSATWNKNKHRLNVQIYDNISLIDDQQDSYLTLPTINYRYSLSPQLGNLSLGGSYSNLQKPENRELRNYSYYSVNSLWKWINYGDFFQTHAEAKVFKNFYDLDAFGEQKQEQYEFYNTYTKLGVELYFDNTQRWYKNYFQTRLTPLLYHLYSPYIDPRDLPFGSYSAKEMDTFRSLLQIYRYNRSDYTGESNRLVGGISQHIIGEDWRAAFTVGKNHDIEPLKEDSKLPTLDEGFSLSFAELSFNYQQFRTNINTQWNDFGDDIKKLFSQLYYEDTSKNVFRINYSKHFNNDQQNTPTKEFLGAGSSILLTSNWRLSSDIEYDFFNKKTSRVNYGAIYNSCCWQVNFVVNGVPDGDNPKQIDYTITLGFILKGLVSLGPAISAEKSLYKQAAGIR